MRKILFVLTVAIVGGLIQPAAAQQQAASRTSLNSITNLQFDAEAIVTDPTTKVVTYTKNVSLKMDHLNFENAGKVVLDWKHSKLTIYDCKKFSFDGTCVVKDNGAKTNTIEYTFNDNTLYIL